MGLSEVQKKAEGQLQQVVESLKRQSQQTEYEALRERPTVLGIKRLAGRKTVGSRESIVMQDLQNFLRINNKMEAVFEGEISFF